MTRVSCKHSGCNRSFPSKAAMRQHFADSHACTGATCNHRAATQVRAAMTDADRCRTCGRSFDTKPALEQHCRDTGHSLPRNPASVSSPLQQTLESIISRNISEILSDQLIAALAISGTSTGRAYDEEIMKKVSCDDCGRSFNDFDALHQHQWDSAYHTRVSRCRMPPPGSNIRQCSQCVEEFSTSHALEKHFICAHPLTEITFNTLDEHSTEAWCHVAAKFKTAWKRGATATAPPPVQVHKIFKVNNTGWRRGKYEEYRAEVKNQMAQIKQLDPEEEEAQLDARRRVLKDGNELQRFHGTAVKCELGRLHSGAGRGSWDRDLLCSIDGCGLCGILKDGFRTAKCRVSRFQRYGRGIYVSATSSKANDYVRMNKSDDDDDDDDVKVMLVTKVLAGRMYRSTQNLTHLSSPPPGFHSVQGVPGPVLNYDELVLYDDRAVLPDYVIFYSLDHV